MRTDLQHRSTLLAESLKETVEPNFINRSENYLQNVVERFSNKERFAGLGIYDNKAEVIAASSTIPEATSAARNVVADAMDSDKANGDDRTDQNIFSSLSNAISISVGKTGQNKADFYLKNHTEVISFLEWMLKF